MENKYHQGKIYKIVCNITGLCYVGSTTYTKLSQRLSCHRTSFKYWKNNQNGTTCSSFKVLENENYDIILIENCACENVDELRKRERYFIETTECVNLIVPTQTRKEYREKNKDKIQEYNHKYKEEHHDTLLEKAKAYREKNPDKIQANNKKHIELPPILCECGLYYTYNHKLRHMKSKTHINRIDPSTIINNKLCKYCSKEISHCNRIRHEKSCQENNNLLS